MEDMIKVDHLVSGYEKVMILHGVDLAMEKGEVISVIGRNGVGKSTLMKTLIGLVRTNDGTITYEG